MANAIVPKYPQAKVEMIDPEMALRFLETMHQSNRGITQSNVDFLAAQMRTGLWRVIHQGLAFDEDGRLIDGQHRLWALIETKMTLPFMVTHGVKREDVGVIDTGIVRTYKDHAHYNGWNQDPMTAALARCIVLGPKTTTRVPAEMVQKWYEFYQDGIDYAIALRGRSLPSRGKAITAPMAAAIARAYYTVQEELLNRFGEILKTGQIAHEADRAAFTLREAWLQGRLGATTSDKYFKTEAALRAFSERRGIRTLQRPESELFAVDKLPRALEFKTANGEHSPRAGSAARRRKLDPGVSASF